MLPINGKPQFAFGHKKVDDINYDGKLEIFGFWGLNYYQIDLKTGILERNISLNEDMFPTQEVINDTTGESKIIYGWTSLMSVDMDGDNYDELIATMSLAILTPKFNRFGAKEENGAYIVIIDLNNGALTITKSIQGNFPYILYLEKRGNEFYLLIFSPQVELGPNKIVNILYFYIIN